MRPTLTVSDLTRIIQETLAAGVGPVVVEGEVSQFMAHRSGHWYFTLKDEGAVLNAVMFRGNNQGMRWMPAVGDQVTVSGELDVYAPQGKYNLLARRMERAGQGDQQRRFEELKRRLQAEGLFDPARKRPLPVIPLAIGVATSPTGAAFQDILRVLSRRFPGLTLYLSACRVQGEGAADEIAAAVDRLGRHGKSSVIIVGRGGGSVEDLAAFNEEVVVRAIARCPIPVVSAVGHEVDVSLADLVADLRAATPSHAAELVVPDKAELLLRLDELDHRLRLAMERGLRARRDRLKRLVLRGPGQRIADGQRRLAELRQRLHLAGRRAVERSRRRLEAGRGRLFALSPLAVLGRGYAVVLKEGRAVSGGGELQPGDAVHLRFFEGAAEATITAASTPSAPSAPSEGG